MNYVITILALCLLMDSLIIAYYQNYLQKSKSSDSLVDISNLNDYNAMVDLDLNCLFKSICCKYSSPLSFKQQLKPNESALSKSHFVFVLFCCCFFFRQISKD